MPKLSFALPLLGLIPFIALGGLFHAGIYSLPIFGDVDDLLVLYGLAIASFMSGSLWGIHLNIVGQSPWAVRLPIYSNLITVLLWLGCATLSAPVYCLFMGLCFVFLLLIDVPLFKEGIIVPFYFRVRVVVSAIVILVLLSIYATSLR